MRILCIEDDRELAEILRRGLAEKLHCVEVVHDGLSARHSALTEEYDLILLDLMIPEIDGVAVCRSVREAGRVTPSIMLTARDQVEDRILGLDSGADDYLIKPFAMG
jgi:DNA-binding response OmpR family regulator